MVGGNDGIMMTTNIGAQYANVEQGSDVESNKEVEKDQEALGTSKVWCIHDSSRLETLGAAYGRHGGIL